MATTEAITEVGSGTASFPALITGTAFLDSYSAGSGGDGGDGRGGASGGFLRLGLDASLVAGKDFDYSIGDGGAGGVAVASPDGKAGGSVTVQDSLLSGSLFQSAISGALGVSYPGGTAYHNYSGSAITSYVFQYGAYNIGPYGGGCAGATISGGMAASDDSGAEPSTPDGGAGGDGNLVTGLNGHQPGGGGGNGTTTGGQGGAGKILLTYHAYTKPRIAGASHPPRVGQTAIVSPGTLDDGAGTVDYKQIYISTTTSPDDNVDIVSSPLALTEDYLGLYLIPQVAWIDDSVTTFGDAIGPVIDAGDAPDVAILRASAGGIGIGGGIGI